MPHPRFQRARAFKFAERTAGNVLVSGTTQAAVDTGLDLTLEAQVGDVVEYGILLGYDNGGGAVYLDIATVVSGSVVNRFSGGSATTGGLAWAYGLASAYVTVGGSMMYALVAGDLSGNLATLRLMARIESSGTRSIYGSNTFNTKLQVWAKNLGPVQPF